MDRLNKYFHDTNFFEWVFYPTKELDDTWNLYLSNHPDERSDILKAYRILATFKTEDKELSSQERISLFLSIMDRIGVQQKNQKRKKIFITICRYAAVALVFFILGSLLFYKRTNFQPLVNPENYTEVNYGEKARIIRGNGESIILDNDKPLVEYKSTGELIVNKLDTIELTHKMKDQLKYSQLLVPYGQNSSIVLRDGTKVYLNAGSRLVYPEIFNEKMREVFLVGEAYFEVTHNNKKPFIVHSNDLNIKVLGTKFNVSVYPSDNIMEAVLVEGLVVLSPNSSGFLTKTFELEPGQLATYNKETGNTILKNVNPDYYTLWKDGLLKFESTDLNKVIRKLERFYNIDIEFKDPALGMQRMSGKLELKEDCNKILDVISSTASVKIIKQEKKYIIYR